MARKPTVDVNKVMDMLLEGQSTQTVADFFGVSRQAIDLHRRKFIQSGQLVERRAPRRPGALTGPAEAGTKGRENTLAAEASTGIKGNHASSSVERYEAGIKGSPDVSPAKSPKAGVKGESTVSLDRLIELIIEAFDSLKQVPKLEAELEKYKRDYLKAVEKIDQLEQAVSKRNEQEARWRLVVPPEGGSHPS